MKMLKSMAVVAVACAGLCIVAQANACPKNGGPNPKDPKSSRTMTSVDSLDMIACPKNGGPKPGEPQKRDA